MAIFVLLLGLQPLPVQSCDMEPASPPAHHAGHGDRVGMGGDTDQQSMDCCQAHAGDDAPACPQSLDCGHSPGSTAALILFHPGSASPVTTRAPTALGDPVPLRITAPLYRPPIS